MNQNKVEPFENRFIDSIIELQSQIKNSRMHSITRSQSQSYDSIYISKIKKINDNLYQIDINSNTQRENNYLNVYGVKKELRTNYELIKLKQNVNGFLTIGTGIRNGLIKIGNRGYLCGSDSTQSISYLQNFNELKFLPFSYKFISLGILGGFLPYYLKMKTLEKI